DALSRAVTLLTFGSIAVELDQLGIVHIAVKGALNGIQVSSEPIASELDSIRQTPRKVAHEDSSGNSITRPYNPGWNQFCVRIDCRPGPYVSRNRFVLGDFWRHILLLAIAECP